MKIQGVQRVSLLDFPEKIACTVFTCGCNFRCPFCHNASLVVPEKMSAETTDEEEFFAFLSTRINKLDGVCITGGEPLLQPDIENFIRRIRALGFSVKLDTNGSRPQILKDLVRAGLIDYVAMDIKNSPERYAMTVGLANPPMDKIRESIAFLLSGAVPYEFRTTVVEEFHTGEDMGSIGRRIKGASRYFLQGFIDSGSLISGISGNLHACSSDQMQSFRRIAAEYIPSTELRGV